MTEIQEKKPRSKGTAETKTQKAAATKPAGKKVTTKATPSAAKATTKTGASRPKKAAANAELRQQLIIETAYYLSEKRRGHCTEQDDWLFAETLVDSLAKALK